MTIMTATKGDKLTWLRQSDALKCTVLETMNNGTRAHLHVEGWLTTLWETLNTYNFKPGHDWKVTAGELVPKQPR